MWQDLGTALCLVLVIEGIVPLDEPMEPEGPFGEMYGYLGLKKSENFFMNITAITCRKDPWILNQFTGVTRGFITSPLEGVSISRLRKLAPQIVDFHSPVEATGLGFLSINKQKPGQALSIGKKVANFTLPATGDKNLSLADFKGKNLVIYFYPKDSTPGCTQEGRDFTALNAKFKRQKTVILGVSRDSLASHEKFKAKQGFPFDLLSDPDEKLCKQFDVIQEKTLYGRKFMGVERSTFLIDSAGKLRHEWRKVKVKGHAQEVLDIVKALGE